jgi:hypothetical protein
MMDSLNDILGNKNFDEPAEVASLKKYVYDNFKAPITVTVREHDLVISVSSAALANMLRLRSPEIKRRCQISDKKLIFRIG